MASLVDLAPIGKRRRSHSATLPSHEPLTTKEERKERSRVDHHVPPPTIQSQMTHAGLKARKRSGKSSAAAFSHAAMGVKQWGNSSPRAAEEQETSVNVSDGDAKDKNIATVVLAQMYGYDNTAVGKKPPPTCLTNKIIGNVEKYECLISTVKNLVNAGADVNAKDIDGQTALHLLVANSADAFPLHLELLKLLVDHGADINVKRTSDGNTALHSLFACNGSSVRQKITSASLLLDAAGADIVSVKNAASLSPYQVAHRYAVQNISLNIQRESLMQLFRENTPIIEPF